jgi:hypothetical protein
LRQVFKIERRNIQTVTGEIEIDAAYGVTSLTAAAASPARLL